MHQIKPKSTRASVSESSAVTDPSVAPGLPTLPSSDVVFLRELTNRYSQANKENIAPSPRPSSTSSKLLTSAYNSPIGKRMGPLDVNVSATPQQKSAGCGCGASSQLDDSIASLMSLAKTPGHHLQSPNENAVLCGRDVASGGDNSGIFGIPSTMRQQQQQQLQLQAILAAAARLSGSPNRRKGSGEGGVGSLSSTPASTRGGTKQTPLTTNESSTDNKGKTPDADAVDTPLQDWRDSATTTGGGGSYQLLFDNLASAAMAAALNSSNSTAASSAGSQAGTPFKEGSSNEACAGWQLSLEEILRGCGVSGIEEGDDDEGCATTTTTHNASRGGAKPSTPLDAARRESVTRRGSAKKVQSPGADASMQDYVPESVLAENDEEDDLERKGLGCYQGPGVTAMDGFTNGNLAELWATLAAAGIVMGDSPPANRTSNTQQDSTSDATAAARYSPLPNFSVSASTDGYGEPASTTTTTTTTTFTAAAVGQLLGLNGDYACPLMTNVSPPTGPDNLSAPPSYPATNPDTVGGGGGGGLPRPPQATTSKNVNVLLEEAFLAARRGRGVGYDNATPPLPASRTNSPPQFENYAVSACPSDRTANANVEGPTSANANATSHGNHSVNGPMPRRTHFMNNVRAAAGSLIAVGGRRVPVTKLHLLHTDAEEGEKELVPSTRRLPSAGVHTTVVSPSNAGGPRGANANTHVPGPPNPGSRQGTPVVPGAYNSANATATSQSRRRDVSPLSAAYDDDGETGGLGSQHRSKQSPPLSHHYDRRQQQRQAPSVALRESPANAKPSSRRLPTHQVHTVIRPASATDGRVPPLQRNTTLPRSAVSQRDLASAFQGYYHGSNSERPPTATGDGNLIVTLKFAKGVLMHFYCNTALGEQLLREEEAQTGEKTTLTIIPAHPSCDGDGNDIHSTTASSELESQASSARSGGGTGSVTPAAAGAEPTVLLPPVCAKVGSYYLARVLSRRSPYDNIGYLDVGVCVHVATFTPDATGDNKAGQQHLADKEAADPRQHAQPQTSAKRSVDGVILRLYDIANNEDDRRQHFTWRTAHRRAFAVCERQFHFLNLPFQLDAVQLTRDMRICVVHYFLAAADDTSSHPNVARLLRDLQYQLKCRICLRNLSLT